MQWNTWYEAVLFANLLSVQQGLTPCYYADSSKTTAIGSTNYDNNNTIYCDFTASGYRLPTDGEREYFTRAGTTGAFSVAEPIYNSGNCHACTAGLMPSLEAVAWFCANAGGTTHPAGTKSANPWNLKDVHGNVWEWCWDWAANNPSGTMTDYTGPASAYSRVIRGAGWSYYPDTCRSGYRTYRSPDTRLDIGFRLVRSLPTTWDWNFGDGTAHGTAQDLTHAYTALGTYNWAMTLTLDGQACVQSGQVVISNTCTAASIATQPASQPIASGASAALNVEAAGSAPFDYQWYEGTFPDATNPIGTDSDSYSTGSLTSTTSFWVHVSNGCGQDNSDTATVTVNGGSGVNISNIKSKTSKAGSAATISGGGFSADKKKDAVYFGTKKATVKKAKTTSLSVKIPKGLKGTIGVYVVVNGQKSNTWPFTVK